MYKIGSSLLEIPKRAIDKFIKWNLQPFKSDEKFDQKIIEAILFVFVGRKKLSENIIDGNLKEFLKGSSGFLLYIFDMERKAIKEIIFIHRHIFDTYGW